MAGMIPVASQRGPSLDEPASRRSDQHGGDLVPLEHPSSQHPLGGAIVFGTPALRHISFHRCAKLELAVRASISSRDCGSRNF